MIASAAATVLIDEAAVACTTLYCSNEAETKLSVAAPHATSTEKGVALLRLMAVPIVGATESAIGDGLGVGEGEGDGEGEGEGDAEGDAEGDGEAKGDGEGVGDAEGSGEAEGTGDADG